MMENSPRASKVNPVLSEPTVDSLARLPTINPAMTTQTSESSAAPTASHAAPPKVNGLIERPKPKKKIGAEEIAERHDESLHSLAVFGFAEYQSEQQRADRFGNMDRLAESGEQEQAGENHDDENFTRRNAKHAI